MKKIIKNNKNILISLCLSAIVAGGGNLIMEAQSRRNAQIEEYKLTIQNLEYELKNVKIENETLTYMNTNYQEENEAYREALELEREKADRLGTKVKELQELVNESIQYDSNNYSRGTLPDKPLDKYAYITADELNEWIAERAPEDSPFIGQGEVFLEASRQSGLDPKYIIAHAGLESGWGTSPIAKDKFNFFGISAFNHDPYNSAKSFSSFEEGIIEGALWIKRNYTDEGQNTLSSMIYGDEYNVYCVDDNGNPSQSWIDKIVDIILLS